MISAPSLTAASAAARAPAVVPPSSLVTSCTEGSLSSNSAISAACFMLFATAAVSPMPPSGRSSAILTGERVEAVVGGVAICAVGAGTGPIEVEQAWTSPASTPSARARSASARPRPGSLAPSHPADVPQRPRHRPRAPRPWPLRREQCNEFLLSWLDFVCAREKCERATIVNNRHKAANRACTMVGSDMKSSSVAAAAAVEMQRHLDRELPPGLYLVATPIGNLARHYAARSRGARPRRHHPVRGHAPQPHAAFPLRHRRDDAALPRAQRRA